MPPHDRGEFERRRQQIIDGALEVFASKGFEKATNKDIAQAANIGSPGLIYHYFKDKSDLFQQVLEQRVPLLQLLAHSGDEILTKPPQEVLTIFGSTFLKTLENPTAAAMFKLVMSEAFRQPTVAQVMNNAGPSREMSFLTRYLAKQISAGVLKRVDPAAAAYCFIGSLLAYIFTREIFPQPESQQLNAETMVETTVQVFLAGMLTDNRQLSTVNCQLSTVEAIAQENSPFGGSTASLSGENLKRK